MFAYRKPMARTHAEIRKSKRRRRIAYAIGAALFAILAYNALDDKNLRGYEGQPFTDYHNVTGRPIRAIANELSKKVPKEKGFRFDPKYIAEVIADSSGVKETFATYPGDVLRVPDFEQFK
jgi:hypothetical protein